MPLNTCRAGALEYLTAPGIGVPHGFTTRRGGVSTGVLESLNLGIHRGDDPKNVEENYRIVASALGFDPKNIILTHQIHSDRVRAVTEADVLPLFGPWPDCDGLVTATAGLALAVFTADCTPILLWDPHTGAVGAAHAGWRGTAADIAGKTVRAMTESYGCRPGDIRAAIGPNIGFCCFETGGEVPQAMDITYGRDAGQFIRPRGEKFYVDLKGLNALSLRRAGVEKIDISADCTVCASRRFWSHRVTRGLRGAQSAIIVCKGGGT